MKTKEEQTKTRIPEPEFLNPEDLTAEQLTDPDYRLKQLMKQDGGHPLTCSKCHHCRR